MNRQVYGQHRRLFGSAEVVGGRPRATSTALQVVIGWCRALKGAIWGGTQNPSAYGLTSSSLVPGISPSRHALGSSRYQEASAASPSHTDRNTDKSRQIATVLRVRQAERDRELTLINIALKSGAPRQFFG